MNTVLKEKITPASLRAAYKKHGYTFFEKGDYNLNIFGVRSNNRTANMWDDVIGLYFKNKSDVVILELYEATTDPGTHYLANLMQPKGAAILVEGQYRGAYKLGLHHKQEALLQVKPVKCYRDANCDNVLDMITPNITEGLYGINIHSTWGTRKEDSPIYPNIGKWSAGCQVIRLKSDMIKFINICKIAAQQYGDTFTYTLFNENDF